jgi:hypothetical protein
MVVLAIAIEVALFFSNKNNGVLTKYVVNHLPYLVTVGFKVHETNVLSFGGHVSSQFLLVGRSGQRLFDQYLYPFF